MDNYYEGIKHRNKQIPRYLESEYHIAQRIDYHVLENNEHLQFIKTQVARQVGEKVMDFLIDNKKGVVRGFELKMDGYPDGIFEHRINAKIECLKSVNISEMIGLCDCGYKPIKDFNFCPICGKWIEWEEDEW